jgi:beta-alanine degradation protein BauB
VATKPMGDVATKIMFENEKVRIWEMRLGPGESSPVHRYDLDYVLVQIDGDRIKGVFEPESAGEYHGEVEADVIPGQFIYLTKGGVETAVNSGHKPYYEILIELKD